MMSPALGTQMDTDEEIVTAWRQLTFGVSCSAFYLFVFNSFFFTVLSVKIRVIRGQQLLNLG
jgi:hypothetical protein